MSKEEDVVHDALDRLEWDERKEEETPFKKMRQLTRRTALTGGAAGIGALILQACGGSSSSSSSSSSATSTGTASAATGGSAAAGIFGVSKSYKFTFVNHVTTNPFFTPTQNGAADACKLLGCSYQWTGSANSNVGEMVSAFNSAVSAGVDGIAVALISLTAFNSPTSKALAAKIPVVAYNADAAGNPRLAYIGQDLFVSGQEMGDHIAQLVPSGDVALFIATPGSLNIQPRIDGAQATLKKHPSIKTHVVATGAALTQELSTIQAYMTSHSSFKGFFAVDGGSTQSVGQTIQKQNLIGKVQGRWLRPHPDHSADGGVGRAAVHDRPAALPAGLPAHPAAVHVPGVTDPDRHRRRQHGSEVPGQDDRGALQQHEEPVRGHQHLARGAEVVGYAAADMATASDKTVTAPPPKGPASGWAQRGGALSIAQRFLTLREGSIIVVTLIAFIYFATTTSHFLTSSSIKALLPYFAPFAILAAGEVFVMINGEIDLSIGAVYLFTPFVFYKLSANVGLPLIPAMIGALIVAMLVGLFNGVVIAFVGISSFVATLGTLFTLDGLTLIISHATQVTTPGTSIVKVGTFAQIFGGGTYSELFWAIGITLLLQLSLSFSRWGIYTVAVGGNRLGASEAGIRTRRVLTGNFVMCALLAGFVGILEAVRASIDDAGPVRLQRHPVPSDLGRRDRGYAAAGRVRDGDRGVHRRDLPGDPSGRPEHQGRQRELLLLLPRPRHPHRDGLQHLRVARADGIRPWRITPPPPSTSSRRPSPTTT